MSAMNGRWAFAAATLLPLKKKKNNFCSLISTDLIKKTGNEAQAKLARGLLNEFALLLWSLATDLMTTLQRKS